MNAHIVVIARKSNILKASVLPKLTYRFNTIPIKIPARFFCIHREGYSKIYKESRGLRTAKTILARIKWRNHSPYIETYCVVKSNR